MLMRTLSSSVYFINHIIFYKKKREREGERENEREKGREDE